MSRPYATALTMAFVTALFGLVASTAHTSVWAPAREGGAPLTQLLGIVAGLTCLGTAVVGAVWFTRGGRSGPERSLGQAIRRAAPATVVGIVLVSLVAISQIDLERYRGPGAEVPGVDLSSGREGVRLRMDWRGPAVRRAGEAEAVDGATVERPSAAAIFLGIILIVGGVALVAVATTWWSTRGRFGRPVKTVVSADPRRQAARGAILVTIGAMLEDPDPRTAIIGAYARLLEELSVSGAARRDYEGPKEHLHRVLTVLDVPAQPLQRLIGLFEEARFSTHALTASHRDQALRALREVASDLAAPHESPPAASVS